MINIQEIVPFMRKGWVAMDSNGSWYWYDEKPKATKTVWLSDGVIEEYLNEIFDIAPADDWTKSLIKIDNTAREKFEEEYRNNIQRTIQELKQDERMERKNNK